MSTKQDNKLKSNLYSDIKERIKADTSRLMPHARLMSRTEMIKKYNVTRTTIEKAISELLGEGYIYTKNGSGTYISDKKLISPKKDQNTIRSWGVILANIVSDTFPEILRGIEDVAEQNNINIIICNTDNDVEKQSNYINKLVQSEIQGVIAIPAVTEKPQYEAFEILITKEIPFVFCNRGVEGISAPRIISNNFYGSYMAAKHLIKMQYSRIGFISIKFYTNIVDQRYLGYLAALYDSGMEKSDYVYLGDDRDMQLNGYNGGKILLEKDPMPDAFVCYNDTMAKGLYSAIEEKGLKVGKDIGVVGYDDSRICEMLNVQLTTVSYPKYETGKSAAELLLRIINGEQIEINHTVVLMPELIIRDSCRQKSE